MDSLPENVAVNGSRDNAFNDFDHFVTPFPERIGTLAGLPYGAAWLLVFACLLSARLFTIFSNSEAWITAIPSTGFAFLPCALGVLIVFYSKLLERFTPVMARLHNQSVARVQDWFAREIKAVFNDKWMTSSGLALTAVYIPVAMQGGFYPEATSSRIVFLVTMAVMSFMGGAMLSVMVGITRLVWRIGRDNIIKVQLFSHPQESIKSVGTLLGKISTSLMAAYFITVLSMVPVTIDFVTMAVTTVFAIVVIVFFIVPQLKIHRIMVENKYNQITMLSSLMEESLSRVKEEPSQENIVQVQRLFDIHRGLSDIDEWPFNHRLFLSVLGSVIVPLVVCAVTFCSNRY